MSMSASLLRAAGANAALTLALLLIPLVAMRFTKEVNWGIGDFVAAAGLLFCAGMVYSIAVRRTRTATQRIVLATLVLAVFGTLWAELAVGLFS
jgi:hypothetical protein